MIQGFRPDPCIRQPQLSELWRMYGEVIHVQHGAIVFLADAEGERPAGYAASPGAAIHSWRGPWKLQRGV